MEDISHLSLKDATEHARLLLHEAANVEIVFRGAHIHSHTLPYQDPLPLTPFLTIDQYMHK